jgi:hypothetical protein
MIGDASIRFSLVIVPSWRLPMMKKGALFQPKFPNPSTCFSTPYCTTFLPWLDFCVLATIPQRKPQLYVLDI